jgi:hypothetical protein
MEDNLRFKQGFKYNKKICSPTSKREYDCLTVYDIASSGFITTYTILLETGDRTPFEGEMIELSFDLEELDNVRELLGILKDPNEVKSIMEYLKQ